MAIDNHFINQISRLRIEDLPCAPSSSTGAKEETRDTSSGATELFQRLCLNPNPPSPRLLPISYAEKQRRKQAATAMWTARLSKFCTEKRGKTDHLEECICTSEQYIALASDTDIQRFYELLFGTPLPRLETFASAARSEKETAEIEAQIDIAIENLSQLRNEWNVLPSEVKNLFGNIDDSKIFCDRDSCTSVLCAIRAYNLAQVWKKLNGDLDLLTREDWSNTGEKAAEELQRKGEDGTRLLDLSHAQITRLPFEITRMRGLEKLDLSHNQMTSLPREITNLIGLEYLFLSCNNLDVLPPEIGMLRNLLTLNVSHNKLSFLPPEIGMLTNLMTLNLSDNQIRFLPPQIGNFIHLLDFDSSHNMLTSLPPEIGMLTSLMTLSISDNQLDALPQGMEKLIKLKSLQMSKNQLTSLPPQIGALCKLTHLDISENSISSLPQEVETLLRLTCLNIMGNPLTSVSDWIVHLHPLRPLKIAIDEEHVKSLPSELMDNILFTQPSQDIFQ